MADHGEGYPCWNCESCQQSRSLWKGSIFEHSLFNPQQFLLAIAYAKASKKDKNKFEHQSKMHKLLNLRVQRIISHNQELQELDNYMQILFHYNIESQKRKAENTINLLLNTTVNMQCAWNRFERLKDLCIYSHSVNGCKLFREKSDQTIKKMYYHCNSLYSWLTENTTFKNNSHRKQFLKSAANTYSVIISELAISYFEENKNSKMDVEFGISLFKTCFDVWSSNQCSFDEFYDSLFAYTPYKLIVYILNFIFNIEPSLIPFASNNNKTRKFYRKIVMEKWLKTDFDGVYREGHYLYDMVICCYLNDILNIKSSTNRRSSDKKKYEAINLILYQYNKLECCPIGVCEDKMRLAFICGLLMKQIKTVKMKKGLVNKIPQEMLKLISKGNRSRMFNNVQSFDGFGKKYTKLGNNTQRLMAKGLSKLIDFDNVNLILNMAYNKECAYCYAKDIKLKKCKGCLQTFYCSKHCGKKGWIKKHHIECLSLRNLL